MATTKVSIGGKTLTALIDTGSSDSFIHKQRAEELFWTSSRRLEQCRWRL